MYALLHKEVQKDIEQTVYASYPKKGKTFHFYFYSLLYSLNFFPSEYNVFLYFHNISICMKDKISFTFSTCPPWSLSFCNICPLSHVIFLVMLTFPGSTHPQMALELQSHSTQLSDTFHTLR